MVCWKCYVNIYRIIIIIIIIIIIYIYIYIHIYLYTYTVNFSRESYNIFCLWCIFLLTIMTMNYCCRPKAFSSPTKNWEIPHAFGRGRLSNPHYWHDPNGKPWVKLLLTVRKNQAVLLPTWNLCINLFFLSKPTYMQKTSIIVQFSLGILQI